MRLRLWELLQSPRFQKQLRKLDPQVARRIIQDLDALKEDPLNTSVDDYPPARRLGLRDVKVAHDWRVFFRIQNKKVLLEFVVHRETGYKEVERYLRSLNI
jgi:mRNA-degrading endonuclease RelE of RelBE toxin-antitoxin system